MSDSIGRSGLLPEFGAPPVVEVAVGVQFRPLFDLRPIELASLRERWRAEYPLVQEQLPLAPVIEAPFPGLSTVQILVGPALQTRLWFLDEEQAELVQLQHDRLTVNWRQTATDAAYPRYPHVRRVFENRFAELRTFVHDRKASLDITQVEITYINAIELGSSRLGRLDQVLRHWEPPQDHHLGEPEQARAAVVFSVPDIGRPPVRMYVAVDPAQGPDGTPIVLLTLTVRGAPDETGLDGALRFMNEAHDHVVRSFAELTPDTMHEKWERRQ